jgi:phage shock protein E
VERGHPVRQRAKPAQFYSVRAARSGGQDVRTPHLHRRRALNLKSTRFFVQVSQLQIVQAQRGPIRMKKLLFLTLMILCAASIACAQSKSGIANPAIDMQGYLRVSTEAAKHRESRRLSEEDFIRMSREPGTVILDARSREKYNELHIKGAINLSFPDITVDSLTSALPDKNTRILIYCNNNFVGAQEAFPTKIAVASLNLSTYISLYSYGYRNVYELGPLLDIKTSKLDLVSASTGQ